MGEFADYALDESLGSYWPDDEERGVEPNTRPAVSTPSSAPSRTWIVVDGDNIAARSFFTTGGLDDGVMFGFFRALVAFQDRFASDDIVICWDRRSKMRQSLYPPYKANRGQNRTPEEQEAHRNLRRQKTQLREEHLTRLGYRNVFHADGFEADDCIASVIKNLPEQDSAVVVSSDHDLYQLINHRVCCYNPIKKETLTLQGFKKQYGISPGLWIDVKAMAGCSSDNIEGIAGVGEKTACKFLSRKLKPDSKLYQKIAGSPIWQRNLELVRLPFPGCPTFELRDNRVTAEKWWKLMDELGMLSLRDQPPISNRGWRKAEPKLPADLRYRSKRRDS